MNELERDIVVVGAGMAGLVAAVEAVRRGRDVTVLEKGSRPGGSMYLSAGILYTYDSYERLRTDIPHGDPNLQKLVVEGKDDGIKWLSDLGIALQEPTGDMTFGSGKQFDPEQLTAQMTEIVEDAGGSILLDAPMTGLQADDGMVDGIEIGGDEPFTITCESVVLATGGFQGNATLVEQFVTESPENLWLRANPWSTGDGLLSARDLGAGSTYGMGTFYGHNLPAPPAEIEPSQFLDAKQAYGVKAVALDEQGRRFTDESASPYEVTLTQDTAKAADGRAYYVVDQDLYSSKFFSRHVSESVEMAAELGGRVATVDSFEELESTLFDWGVNGARAVKTLTAFNQAVTDGYGRELDPPRKNHRTPIDTPPFYLVEVQPGITFTMGGIDVNRAMEVVRRAETRSLFSREPGQESSASSGVIRGLYAAGADVGNVMHRRYMGGLCVALVTGRIAGQNAAEA